MISFNALPRGFGINKNVVQLHINVILGLHVFAPSCQPPRSWRMISMGAPSDFSLAFTFSMVSVKTLLSIHAQEEMRRC